MRGYAIAFMFLLGPLACFDDPEPSSTATSEGSTDATTATSASGGADTTATTTTAADSSGGADTTGGPGGGVLFDFYAEACGAGVIRAGSNDDAMGPQLIACDTMSPVGVVQAFEMADGANGSAARVVLLGFPMSTNAALGIESSAQLPLFEANEPRLTFEIDCPPMLTGSLNWIVALANGDTTYETIQGGSHDCAGARTVVDVSVASDTDRAVSISVINPDGMMRAAMIIDPVITAP